MSCFWRLLRRAGACVARAVSSGRPVDSVNSPSYTHRHGSPFHSRAGSAAIQIASHAGTDTERLVKDAVLRLLEQDARFRTAVRKGIAQADRGEFIEEEEMDARIERMLKS